MAVFRELMLRKETARVNETESLGKQNCHNCLPCRAVDLLQVLAALAKTSFIHIEMLPRAALWLIKINPSADCQMLSFSTGNPSNSNRGTDPLRGFPKCEISKCISEPDL